MASKDIPSFDFTSLVSKKQLNAAVCKAIGSDSVEVVSYDVSKATEEIEGFTSIMLRVKVNFLYNGDRFSKMVIMKRMPIVPIQLQMVQAINAFEKEIRVFTEPIEKYKVLPGVNANFLPLPKCYITEADGTNDTLIMEDLKDSGFKLGDKLKGLDLDHCLLVMKALGKLHALSIIHEREKNIPLGDVYPFLAETFLKPNDPTFQTFLQTTFDVIIGSLKTLPEYHSILPALGKRFDGLWNESCELVKTSESTMNVLCHGDCWVNNMMFRYENDNDHEKPVEIKFIDLQVARYAPPATDIVYFLFTSTVPSVRNQHTRTILETYHESLESTLFGLGASGPSLTLEELVNCFEERKPFGALMACWLRMGLYYGEVEKLPKDFNDADPEYLEEMFKGNFADKAVKAFSESDDFRMKFLEIIDDALAVFGLK